MASATPAPAYLRGKTISQMSRNLPPGNHIYGTIDLSYILILMLYHVDDHANRQPAAVLVRAAQAAEAPA
jgi:hypothetical protein